VPKFLFFDMAEKGWYLLIMEGVYSCIILYTKPPRVFTAVLKGKEQLAIPGTRMVNLN